MGTGKEDMEPRKFPRVVVMLWIAFFCLYAFCIQYTEHNTRHQPQYAPLRTPSYQFLNNSSRPILKSVNEMNQRLEQIRVSSFTNDTISPWKPVKNSGLKVIRETKHFVKELGRYPTIECVTLPYDRERLGTDLLVTERYPLVVSEPLCTWMNTPGYLPHGYSEAFKGRCSTNLSSLKYPTESLRQPDGYLTYVHVIKGHSVINKDGFVIHGDLKITPASCSKDKTDGLRIRDQDKLPMYEEVFVITQFWGTAYFHRLAEVLPRLAPFVQFLRRYNGVRIHTPSADATISKLLMILGLSPERIITGVVRARIVYLPKGSPCGRGGLLETQLLSALFRDYIHTYLSPASRPRNHTPSLPTNQTSPFLRNKVILIKRSHSRRLAIYDEVRKFLATETKARGLVFVEWRDDPVLSMEEGMEMFHDAVMVVAPHGAGETNLIFSKPGTYVIELLCESRHINLCYQALSDNLGLRYHGIPGRGGCESVININMEDLKTVVIKHMQQITENLAEMQEHKKTGI